MVGLGGLSDALRVDAGGIQQEENRSRCQLLNDRSEGILDYMNVRTGRAKFSSMGETRLDRHIAVHYDNVLGT